MAAACTINEVISSVYPIIKDVSDGNGNGNGNLNNVHELIDEIETCNDHVCSKIQSLIEIIRTSKSKKENDKNNQSDVFATGKNRVREAIKDLVEKIDTCSIGVEGAKKTIVNKKVDAPEFYNLTLTQKADINDKMINNEEGGNFFPIGSLLEFIDNYYEKPEMRLDRTMGKEINVLSSIHVFDDIKDHVHFKSFDRFPGYMPAKHGDFNLVPFWREKFWGIDKSHKTNILHNNELKRINCWVDDWRQKEDAFKIIIGN